MSSRLVFSAKDAEDYRTIFDDERGWSVGKWYRQKYPTDTEGKYVNQEISFNQLCILMKYGVPFYELIGVGDSIIRERIFDALAQIYGVNYSDVYDMWSRDAYNSSR